MSKKKHKCGDVREDGMVFWRYDAKSLGGEYWMSPEKFDDVKVKVKKQKERKRKLFEKHPRIHHKGDQRLHDNKFFWAYASRSKGFEIWLTQEEYVRRDMDGKKAFQKRKREMIKHIKNIQPMDRRKSGDTRDKDDKVFFQYAPTQRNYEQWVSQKTYKKWMGEKKDRVKNYKKTEKFREYARTYQRVKRANDPLYNLTSRIRNLIYMALFNKGYTKKSRMHKILGCSYEELKTHLENQFTRGMTWDNAGEWHIDHRLPLAAATTEDEVIKLNHYTNLQPLWAKVNLRKGDKHDPAELKAYLAA